MKKYIYSLMLVVISFQSMQAQRMLPKQKGFEINTGVLSLDKISDTYYMNIAMTINAKNGNYKLWSFEYTKEYQDYKSYRIPLETYTLQGGYSFFLLGDPNKNITLNVATSALIGYESIHQGKKILYDGAKILSSDNFIYGASARLTVETYLSDRFVLLLNAKTKLLWATDLKPVRPSVGLGVRFNL